MNLEKGRLVIAFFRQHRKMNLEKGRLVIAFFVNLERELKRISKVKIIFFLRLEIRTCVQVHFLTTCPSLPSWRKIKV